MHSKSLGRTRISLHFNYSTNQENHVHRFQDSGKVGIIWLILGIKRTQLDWTHILDIQQLLPCQVFLKLFLCRRGPAHSRRCTQPHSVLCGNGEFLLQSHPKEQRGNSDNWKGHFHQEWDWFDEHKWPLSATCCRQCNGSGRWKLRMSSFSEIWQRTAIQHYTSLDCISTR